jgi:hypothetical protein
MLFLLQSAPRYLAPHRVIYRKPVIKPVEDDEIMLMVWFTYFARYYAK